MYYGEGPEDTSFTALMRLEKKESCNDNKAVSANLLGIFPPKKLWIMYTTLALLGSL